ncbi:MAG: hypothetical protein NC489_46320 [Ruminococcus flavefaciens]|nr:hypothetical protein [Ruminococcus flavefaciens]
MNILGQYDFENFTLLSALMDEKEIINTAIHEYTHFGLSNQSTYGIVLYCLNRLIIPYDCKSDINKQQAAIKFFMDHTIKVQEGMAVFIECIYFMLRDKKEYIQFIEDLRQNNSTYYEYVKPLRYILNILEKDGEYEDILIVANAVFQVAIMSMNAPIYKLEGANFATNKFIKKMLSRQDFSKNYIPNKRFFAAIDSCKEATSCVELSEQLLKCAGITENVSSIVEPKERLDNIKVFVLSIFADSKYYALYVNKLAGINTREINGSDLFLQQLPTAFNEDYIKNNMKKIDSGTLKTKCKTVEYSTFFMLGNLKDNTFDMMRRMGIVEFPEFEDEREVAFFYGLRKKEIYACLLECNQLHEILLDKDRKCVLLTSYKNYDYQKMCIPNHSDIEDYIYIYCDRTYSNASSYLDQWKSKEVYYRYMQYESMIVLLVKIDDRTIFLLPMTPIVADEADRDIRENRKNMMMITDVKDEEIDSHIITDSTKRDEIDTIINCLFFLNLEPQWA